MHHNRDALGPGDRPPGEVHVVVEIPQGSSVKYEVDKETGALFVDRFLYTASYYPFNYGFIPGTLDSDGDPIDVGVLSLQPVFPTSVIRARPVAVLLTRDEKGQEAIIEAGFAEYRERAASARRLPPLTERRRSPI
jgi:inorganic pyrophosphatase